MAITLFIKNMVCNRCIMVVNDELKKSGFVPTAVKLGEAEFNIELSKNDISVIKQKLEALGFELIDDKRIRIIEQIKNIIIELIYYTPDLNGMKINLSGYISQKLHYEYTYLSNLFSEIENTTIEQYYIIRKIERIKELLVYDELSLNEIADLMGYSSSAYLSAQFKKVTGLTPSHFKKIKEDKRKPDRKSVV